MSNQARKKVVTYLVLTFTLSSVFYYLILSAGSATGSGRIYVYSLMWCPGISALLTRLLYQRNLRGFGWGWGQTRYQVTSYAIPLLVCIVVYGIVWLSGIGGFSGSQMTDGFAEWYGFGAGSFSRTIFLLLTYGFLRALLFAFGEEVGWRGLLVPELMKFKSFTTTAILSGTIWAFWHYPILFFSDYNSGMPLLYAGICFTAIVIGCSFTLTWLRLKSASLWTAAILHASHNLFVQGVFDAATVDHGITRYITTEFGCGIAILYAVLAYFFWRRRAELEGKDTEFKH